MSNEVPTAQDVLRGVVDDALDAVGQRDLPELLADVVQGLRDVLDSSWAAVLLWATDGRPELVLRAGDAAATSAVELSAPVLLRGRAGGTVEVGGIAERAEDPDATVQVAAAGIGAIVERARTAAANRRRERWMSGGTEIARALTTDWHDDPLTMIAERAAEIGGADAVLLLSAGALPGFYRVDAVGGAAALRPGQQVPDTDDGDIARTFTEGRAVRLGDARFIAARGDLRTGASVLAPMHGSTGLRGVMCFGRFDGRPFGEAELGMATMFASTVALALELSESQNRREQTALILERDRIARDLHDHVIQRLYAIGLTMQHVSSLVGEETAERLVAAVTDIDAAIAQIRSTIFRLTTPILSSEVSLRARAEALVDELEPVLGYRPTLVSEGPLDFGLDDDLVTDCEAVLREGITNIARHAHATRADVRIAVGRSHVRIEIADDGRGLGESARRSGLANLRQRAEQQGGTLEIGDTGGRGTRIVWTVPLGE